MFEDAIEAIIRLSQRVSLKVLTIRAKTITICQKTVFVSNDYQQVDSRFKAFIKRATSKSPTPPRRWRQRSVSTTTMMIMRCDIITSSIPQFSRFLFRSLFRCHEEGQRKFLLASPFSYHLFVCYLHHLHQITPQSSFPKLFSLLSVLPRKKEAAPDDFFPLSVRYPYYGAKGNDNVYIVSLHPIRHHDKKGKNG